MSFMCVMQVPRIQQMSNYLTFSMQVATLCAAFPNSNLFLIIFACANLLLGLFV